LPDHQVHDIVGVRLRLNAIEIPTPAPRVMVEADHALLGQRVQELTNEERVAGRLAMYQVREWRRELRLAAKGIGNQLRDVFAGQRRKSNLLDLRARLVDGFDLALQWMSGLDLVIPVGADQQEVPQIRPG